MQELIEQSGYLLWVQLAFAFIGLVIVFERVLYFQAARTNAPKLLLGVGNHLRKKSYAEAIHVSSRAHGAAARVVHTLLLRHDLPRSDLRDLGQEAVQLEVPRMERGLRTLLGIALLSPLLGILGTILSLMSVYSQLAADSLVQRAELSVGLFQSLTSTAIGLSLSTAAYLFYLALLGKARRLLNKLTATAIETINLICDTRGNLEATMMQESLAMRARELAEARRQRLSADDSTPTTTPEP